MGHYSRHLLHRFYQFPLNVHFLLLNSVLYRNFDLVEQPIKLETLSDRYTRESIEFIENSQKIIKAMV
jgi:hypothetical protein